MVIRPGTTLLLLVGFVATLLAPLPRAVVPRLGDEPGIALAQGLPEGNRSHGRRLFREECRNCHSVKRGKHGTFGPNLHRVIGRQAGRGEAYDYSDALAAAGFTWTVERLDTWLTDPQSLVPDNAMGFPGLPDAIDRANVIAYLIAAARR